MDKFKTKIAYIRFYKLVCFLLTLLSLFFIYKFGSYLWETRQPYIDTFQNNILGDKSYPAQSTEIMLEHLKNTGIVFGIFVVSLIVISFIKKIWKALPVPGSFIKYWDEQGEISHILGRCICNHLRANTNFSNEEWATTVQYADEQRNFFIIASNSKNYSNIFQKYDTHFNNDTIGKAVTKNSKNKPKEKINEMEENEIKLRERAIELEKEKVLLAENAQKFKDLSEKKKKEQQEPTLD